jgi:hypothetical protein
MKRIFFGISVVLITPVIFLLYLISVLGGIILKLSEKLSDFLIENTFDKY